ncbi:hypothetical protein AX16_005749 [Volvariella volvacea WC 439]|nr:hypothetical protein AX16_005749 [Volvariella volvacea WC 439]
MAAQPNEYSDDRTNDDKNNEQNADRKDATHVPVLRHQRQQARQPRNHPRRVYTQKQIQPTRFLRYQKRDHPRTHENPQQQRPASQVVWGIVPISPRILRVHPRGRIDRREPVHGRHAQLPQRDHEQLPRLPALEHRGDRQAGGDDQADRAEDDVELCAVRAGPGPEGLAALGEAEEGVVREDVGDEAEAAVGEAVA